MGLQKKKKKKLLKIPTQKNKKKTVLFLKSQSSCTLNVSRVIDKNSFPFLFNNLSTNLKDLIAF